MKIMGTRDRKMPMAREGIFRTYLSSWVVSAPWKKGPRRRERAVKRDANAIGWYRNRESERSAGQNELYS